MKNSDSHAARPFLIVFVLILLLASAGTVRVYASGSTEETKIDLSEATVTLPYEECTYNGSERRPNPTVTLNGTKLKKNRDYTLIFKNNVDAGTATVVIKGIGNYTGRITQTYTIKPKSIASQSAAAEVMLSKTSYTYNGNAKKPSVTVEITLKDAVITLKKGTDYTVTYKNNTKAGTASVVIKGTGNYKGTLKASFEINPKSISKGSVSLSSTSYTYNGNAKKPSATVKVEFSSGEKTLKKNTDYTVSYSHNTSIGTATVKIKGTGNYTGTLTTTFKIKPKKVTVSSVSSSTAGKITVSWEKSSGSVKYQIYYKTESASKWSKVNVGSSKTSKTLSGLKASTTYEIKIRAYKEVSGKKYYGAWSDIQTVKCKSEKIVYLTFDDGPAANMGKVLDVLDEYGVKATFFVTGNNASYRYLITRAYEEGHAIGLHSYTHDYSKIYASTTAFYKDMAKISDLVEELTGEKTYLLRFPGGSSNTVSRRYCKGIMSKLTKMVEEDGYTYFDWNVDSTDASGNNVAVKTLVANATSSSAKEINILMHCTDAKGTTVKALPQIIEYYQKKGYDFEVLTADSYTAHHGVNN